MIIFITAPLYNLACYPVIVCVPSSMVAFQLIFGQCNTKETLAMIAVS